MACFRRSGKAPSSNRRAARHVGAGQFRQHPRREMLGHPRLLVPWPDDPKGHSQSGRDPAHFVITRKTSDVERSSAPSAKILT